MACGGGNASRCRAVRRPEVGVIRDWRVLRIESLRGCVEQTKSLRGDSRDHLSGDAAPRKCLPDAEQTAGSSDGGHNRIRIEGAHATEIHNLDFGALGGKFL